MRFKTFALSLFMLLAGLVCTVLIGFFLINHVPAIDSFSAFLQQDARFFCIWRWVCLALFLLFWPTFVQILGRWQHWTDDVVVLLIHLRWQITSFFLIFELLISAIY